MALDMYSESSPSLNSSPRLSFSHNLHQTDTPPTTILQIEDNPYQRLDSSLLDSNPDFNFCITNHSIEVEPSSADELFSQGLIRPLQLQDRFVNCSKHVSISNSQLPPLPTLSKNGNLNQESSKAIIVPAADQNHHHHHHHQPNSNSKSFWRIKRSSSLHVDNTYKKSSFWSSLPLLSRSNSTGSVPSPKQNSQRQQPKTGMYSSSSSFYMYPAASQKPPLKRNYGGGGGYRISPVLNVPPPFISKGTASLFGLGSLFGNGKDKKNKK